MFLSRLFVVSLWYLAFVIRDVYSYCGVTLLLQELCSILHRNLFNSVTFTRFPRTAFSLFPSLAVSRVAFSFRHGACNVRCCSSLRSHNSAASASVRRRPMSPRLDAGDYHSDGRRIYSWGALSRARLPEGVHWNEKEVSE